MNENGSKVWLVKARWRGTALVMKIKAKDADEAWTKAKNKVLRMEGSATCMDIVVMGEQ